MLLTKREVKMAGPFCVLNGSRWCRGQWHPVIFNEHDGRKGYIIVHEKNFIPVRPTREIGKLLRVFLIKTAPSATPSAGIFSCWTQVFLLKKDLPGLFFFTKESSGPRSRMVTSNCRNKKIQFSGKENSCTNKSKNRTVPDEVRTLSSLFKERFLIGWKSLGGPCWSRHTVRHANT